MEISNKLDFLVPQIKERFEELQNQPHMVRTAGLDNMQGSMSIPEPMLVSANNGMTGDDYNDCASIVSVCRNMIQRVIVDNNPGKEDEAIRNISSWVKGFLKFPYPIFNFIDYQSDRYKEDNFSFSANPEAVEKILSIKDVPDLKDALFSALHASGEDGKLAAYSNKERDFEYFGIINAYTQTDVFIRVIRFTMHMQNTNVDALCTKTQKTALDSHYTTYRFSANKALMIGIQKAMNEGMIDDIASQLLELMKQTNKAAMEKFSKEVKGD